jgi:4-hydroxybenzoate polyprenyltransferase
MITSTILIAIAGYISNDYFDVLTDKVNKPEKLYIDIYIPARIALLFALICSLLAMVVAIWLTWLLQSLYPVLLLFLALVVAWWYALKLKRSFLWGNIAVSGMSAGTIAMAWVIENDCSHVTEEPFGIITAIVTAISIFAFLLSLLREIVKDIEDMEGDKLINCHTLPLVKGIPFTKTFLTVIVWITFVLLLITQINLAQFSRFVAIVWLLIFVEIPLLYFIKSLKIAKTKSDYHLLSTMLKWIMLGGMGTIIAGQF